jgi:RimJ/RimL family protein N-acetyltransferase
MVCLQVFANNTDAIALYKKFGFVEEGRKVKEIKFCEDRYDDVILMAKFIE